MTPHRIPHLQRLTAWRPGAYLRSSAGLFGWMILRAGAQACMILVMARLLGPEGYGHFIAVLAVASFFSPLAGLGLSGVLLRDLARNPKDLPELLGTSLKLWCLSTLGFGMAATGVTLWFFPSGISITLIACFTLGEVASSSLTDLAARVEQSQHRADRFGAINAGLVLARLIGLALYALIVRPELHGWMGVYATTSLLYAIALYVWLIRQHRPVWSLPISWSLVGAGLPFTVGALSYRMQAEFNKPLLAQLGYAQAGYFSAAQRMVDLSSLPLSALQESLWSRVFADQHPMHRLLHAGAMQVMLALLAGLILSQGAFMLPVILGPGFEQSIELLVMLAWLPTIQIVKNLLNAQLIAKQMASHLTTVYVLSGIVGIFLSTSLIRNHSINGAVTALYLTDLFTISILSIFINVRKTNT